MNIKLVCLTCDDYRKQHMKAQLDKTDIDYEFFDGVKNNDVINYYNTIYNEKNNVTGRQMRTSEVAIALGHFFITKKFMEGTNDICVICEDDLVFLDFNIKNTILGYIKKFINIDDPFIIYGCCILNKPELVKIQLSTENILITSAPRYGNVFYIFNRPFAKIVLDNFFPIRMAYDDYLKGLISSHKIKCYHTSPFLCYELSSMYYEMFYQSGDEEIKKKLIRLSGVNSTTEHIKNKIRYNRCGEKNFGDVLNDYILIRNNYSIQINKSVNHLLMIGSIIEYCNNNSIICGSGIINSKSIFPNPYLVLFVRGPLTRKRFMELGYYCPENYGDVGLLLSCIYKPNVITKKYKIGIIPHHIDYNEMISFMDNINCNFDYTIIDFRTNIDDIEKVIDHINECEYIISSSLHGIITAHSYGIKTIWISSFKKLYGDNIKFLDYYASIDIHDIKPALLDNDLIDDIDSKINMYCNPDNQKISSIINNIKKIIPLNINYIMIPIVNQISNATQYNRYPEIFSEIKKIIINPKILSFGCSKGLECNTLSDLYFKDSLIDGVDINKKNILYAVKNNKNSKINYYDDITNLDKYDIIFCMSVLCRHPIDNKGIIADNIFDPSSKTIIINDIYPFDAFNDTIALIDNHVALNGYLCIYNSSYLFTDTETSKKYQAIITEYTDTGFVIKYDKNNNIVKNYPYFLFKKIIS